MSELNSGQLRLWLRWRGETTSGGDGRRLIAAADALDRALPREAELEARVKLLEGLLREAVEDGNNYGCERWRQQVKQALRGANGEGE